MTQRHRWPTPGLIRLQRRSKTISLGQVRLDCHRNFCMRPRRSPTSLLDHRPRAAQAPLRSIRIEEQHVDRTSDLLRLVELRNWRSMVYTPLRLSRLLRTRVQTGQHKRQERWQDHRAPGRQAPSCLRLVLMHYWDKEREARDRCSRALCHHRRRTRLLQREAQLPRAQERALRSSRRLRTTITQRACLVFRRRRCR